LWFVELLERELAAAPEIPKAQADDPHESIRKGIGEIRKCLVSLFSPLAFLFGEQSAKKVIALAWRGRIERMRGYLLNSVLNALENDSLNVRNRP